MESFYMDEANRACSVDDDCEVVSTGCSEPSSAYCGQLALSQSAAESSEWEEISAEGKSSCSESCATCDAQLVVQCVNKVCK